LTTWIQSIVVVELESGYYGSITSGIEHPTDGVDDVILLLVRWWQYIPNKQRVDHHNNDGKHSHLNALVQRLRLPERPWIGHNRLCPCLHCIITQPNHGLISDVLLLLLLWIFIKIAEIDEQCSGSINGW